MVGAGSAGIGGDGVTATTAGGCSTTTGGCSTTSTVRSGQSHNTARTASPPPSSKARISSNRVPSQPRPPPASSPGAGTAVILGDWTAAFGRRRRALARSGESSSPV